MTEYLNKRAVLEWIDDRRYKSPWIESFRERLEAGAFDADESEGTWKATAEVLGRENAQMNSEIRRLRAALEKARTYIFNGYDLGYIDDREGCTKPLLRQIDEALSTTTEPTGVERAREYYRKLEELRNRTRYRDAAIEYEQRMTDICNVLDFLGITIPGINAPKKEGRTE